MRPQARYTFVLGALVAAPSVWVWIDKADPVAVRVHTSARGLVRETVANSRAGTVKAFRLERLAPSVGGYYSRCGNGLVPYQRET